MGYFNRMWGVFVALVSVAGCGGEGDSDPDPDPAADPRPGCQHFQDAVCARADRCKPGSGGTCLTALRMTFCKSEQAATACAASSETVACGEDLACGLEVLDRQPAADACNRLLEATCDARQRCNPGLDREQCLSEARAQVDCATAIGVAPGYQGCLDALGTSLCSTPPSAQCTGVIASAPGFPG